MQISLRIVNENGVDKVFYHGPINEDAEVHLAPLLQSLSKSCVFNFKNVGYVNSCGVRAWINFMRDVEKNRTVTFEECTPEIVMQINMIPSFKSSAVVKSVYASYACPHCGHEQRALFESGKNMPDENTSEFPEVKCDKCNSTTEMEELEDEFFAFAIAS